MLMMWLYVGLRVCDVLFSCSFLPVTCPGIQILLAQGCIVGSVLELWMFLSVFLPYVENALPAQMAKWEQCHWCYACTFFYEVMCIVLLSAGVVWKCVLLFRIMIMYGVKYRILEFNQHSVNLFILLVGAINMVFFKAVHMSAFLGYLYYFHCVLYVFKGVSCGRVIEKALCIS
jgi:hypothetical protein